MSGWDGIGVILGFANIVLAFLIALSLPELKRRGNTSAGILYLILALATIIWITRSA